MILVGDNIVLESGHSYALSIVSPQQSVSLEEE